MSENSLLPNAVVSIIKEHGYKRFNLTWLGNWEAQANINRKDSQCGHFGKGGKYFWNRGIIEDVLKYCEARKERLM